MENQDTDNATLQRELAYTQNDMLQTKKLKSLSSSETRDASLTGLTGIFCRIGYRSDETDPNPILCIYYSVLLLSPTKAQKHYKAP